MSSNYRGFIGLGKPKRDKNLSVTSDIIGQKKTCGVYYLTDGLDVLYVGASTNVEQRVKNWGASDIDFSQVFVDECTPDELERLERNAINHYPPPLNVIGIP